MRRRLFTVFAFVVLAVALAALSGCPFEFDKEPRDNTPPNTFFLTQPPDTTFQNLISFNWNGVDLDSDVVAYQFQLVVTDAQYYFTGGAAGQVLESIDPRGGPGEQWSARTLDVFRSFTELDDGYYEFRIRSIDADGVADPEPGRHRFFVFYDDVVPDVVLLSPTQARLNGLTSAVFVFNASDQSRNSTTPREQLEYSYQLRALSLTLCTTHTNDQPTEFRKFPPGTDPVTVGNEPPTLYSDLIGTGCEWMFTLRVRDPARNIAILNFRIEQNGTGGRSGGG